MIFINAIDVSKILTQKKAFWKRVSPQSHATDTLCLLEIGENRGLSAIGV